MLLIVRLWTEFIGVFGVLCQTSIVAVDPDGWVRFHSLPESTQYADTDDEYAEANVITAG